MKNVLGFRCVTCCQEHGFLPGRYNCPSCGGNLDVVYDYHALKQSFSRTSLAADSRHDIWRYAPLLPVSGTDLVPPLAVGWSPLYHTKRLGNLLGLNNLYVKDDGRNPSASFKDRASAVALVRALEIGADIVTGASTGNAGCSMACLAASVGMPAVIFVPETAPKAKIAQLLIFGATVVAVKGSYDDAFDLCLNVTSEFGWYNRNTGFNPFTREGKKTCVLEICEQMAWRAPDTILVSVGDGNIISGFWKGLRDLMALGFIDKLPRLIAVQSTLSNAIAKTIAAMRDKGIKYEPTKPFPTTVEEVRATTIADSISVDIPRDGVSAVRAVLDTGGDAIEVSDAEILAAIALIGNLEGIFAEPAASTTIAGLKKMVEQGRLRPDERVVCLISGNGLKDVPSAMKVAGSPHLIDPDLAAFKKLGLIKR